MGLIKGMNDIVKKDKRRELDNEFKYLTLGNYDKLKIEDCKFYQKGAKLLFIAELEVVEHSADQAAGANPVPVGHVTSWCIDLSGKYPESSLRDLKRFLEAASGEPLPEDADTFINEQVTGPSKVLTGRLLKARTWPKPTRNGGVFTKTDFGVFDGEQAPVQAAPPVPTTEDFSSLGYQPNPQDTTGQWYYNADGDQKTADQLRAML